MRILVIEDDPDLADFVRSGLMDSGYEVDHADHAAAAHALIQEHAYGCLIVDVLLPDQDGISLVAKLREARLTQPILLMSAKQSVETRVEGLRLGGDDFLVKPFSFTELLARVEALIRRASGYAEQTEQTVGDLSLNLISRKVHRGDQEIDLQTREFDLLAFLMRHRGRVVSKSMIIENVWNFNFDPLTNIVEARMSKLRDKVDKPFRTKLIHTVRGAGYVLRDG